MKEGFRRLTLCLTSFWNKATEYHPTTVADPTCLRPVLLPNTSTGLFWSCAGYFWKYYENGDENKECFEVPIRKESKIKVVQLSLDGEFIRLFDSRTDAERKLEYVQHLFLKRVMVFINKQMDING